MHELPPLFGPGQHLGRYELLQRLAVGGMAEVYLAYAVGPGDFRKVVAIKRLLPQHALDPQLLRMFLDEARLMARLSHPNIPQVTDVDDGRRDSAVEVPYFVMEYVHGTDLRGVLNAAAGPLPIEHALAIASAVAAGLHHAHEHRGAGGQRLEIVHRDVSPSNILISFDGGVKVTDFGVAKWTEQKSFTHQGQLKGKFAHMSPEQCRGEALDRRSDVFALGTLLYEMTTGNPPFVAESEYELLTQIVSREAPPPERAGEPYPTDLAAIVMRSLGRAREDRYQSAQQLQLALESFAREHKLMVSPVAMAGYLESMFGARVTEWREAQASGKTLADHLAREGRPANGANQAAANAADRTATDVFAVAPAITMTGNPDANPPVAGRRARSTSKTRALLLTGAAALALVSLLVATELTSRWQRIVRPASPAQSMDPVPAAPALAEGPMPTGQSPSPAPQPAPARPPSSGAAETIPAPAPAGRRGRDSLGTSRPSRRETTTPTASATASDRQATSATSAAAAPPPAAPPIAEPQRPPPVTTPTSAPAERPAPSPPPTPVKVWDPDSPVPP